MEQYQLDKLWLSLYLCTALILEPTFLIRDELRVKFIPEFIGEDELRDEPLVFFWSMNMKFKLTLFKSSSAALSFGQKVVYASDSSSQNPYWWIPVIKKTVKLKKSFLACWAMIDQVSGSQKNYRFCCHRNRTSDVGRVILREWIMTFSWPKRGSGKQLDDSGGGGGAKPRLIRGGEPLTLKEENIKFWKEHFNALLNASYMSSIEVEDSGEAFSKSLADVTGVVKKAPPLQGTRVDKTGHCWAILVGIPCNR